MVRTISEAANPVGKGQGISGQSEEIIRYLYRRLSTLYKVFAAKRQTRATASCFCIYLSSNLGDWKEYHEARFASFYVLHPVFNISLLKKYYRDQLGTKVL